jgi:hypothetical protein
MRIERTYIHSRTWHTAQHTRDNTKYQLKHISASRRHAAQHTTRGNTTHQLKHACASIAPICIQEQDTQHNTQQEGTQPTNSITHAHREVLYIITYKGLACRIIVGSRFDDWICWTSVLELHLIMSAHILNPFWITYFTAVWICDCSRVSCLSNSVSLLRVLVLYYDRRSVGLSVLEYSTRLGLTTRFLLVRHLYFCWCGALSLMRGRVCRLELLLVPSSAVIFRSESRELVTIFYSLRFETSLIVASCDSQGYSGGIRPHLQVKVKVKVTLRLTFSESVGLGVEPHMFITLWHLRSCFCGAPSLTGGRVSRPLLREGAPHQQNRNLTPKQAVDRNITLNTEEVIFRNTCISSRE